MSKFFFKSSKSSAMFTPRSTLFFSAQTMFMFYHIVVNGQKDKNNKKRSNLYFLFFKIQSNLQSRLFSLGCPPVLVEPRKENINIKHNKQTIKTKKHNRKTTTKRRSRKHNIQTTTIENKRIFPPESGLEAPAFSSSSQHTDV